MGLPNLLPSFNPRDPESIKRTIHKLTNFLGQGASPTFAGLTLTDLTASRLIASDATKALASVTDLTAWVAGTANEIDVSDDGDGTITIGIVDPLIVSKGGTGAATLTDHGLLVGSGTDPITALGVATNGQLPIGSTGADPVLATLTGTANQITVTNGAGSITLATPQDIHTGASPTFAGLTINGLITVDQDSDALGINIDSEATTLTNYGLQVVTGQGAIAARIAYGTTNEGQFLAGLPNNSSYVGNFSFYRNLDSASTDNAIVYIHNDHASDDQPCLELQQDGSGPALIAEGDITCNGEINVTGGVTISTDIVIPDGGYIGSVSDTDAIQIEADGDVVLSQALYVTSDLHMTGNIIVTDDAGIGVADNNPLIVFDDTDGQVEITGDLTISGITTASRLLSADANRKIVSTDLNSWIAGTANQVSVADDGDGTVTLSTPQNIHTGASPTFVGLTLSGMSVAGFVKNDASGILSGGNSLASSDISDFDEAAQDAVGTILSDSSSIDFTYTDGTPEITAVVLPAGVDHNSLNNYAGDEHIDHSGVSVSAGSGLTGGGDITSTRTLSVDINGLVADATPDGSADYVMSYDASAAGLKKVLMDNLPGGTGGTDEKVKVDAAAAAGYVGAASNDGVLRTGTGLSYTDGGDYVTLALSHLGIESLSDPGGDRILFWDDSETACKWLTATEGIQIATTNLKSDISGLTADAAPDSGSDYVMTFDATDSTHKKVTIDNLLNAGAGSSSEQQSRVLVYLGSNQSIPSGGTATQIEFDTEVYDGASEFNTGTYRFTASEAGYYHVSAMVRIYLGATLNAQIFLKKNGTVIAQGTEHQTDYYAAVGLSTDTYLAANDYLELFINHSNASSRTIYSGLRYTWLAIHRFMFTGVDEKVAVDSAATSGYLGAASNDGVLRTGTGLGYTDGGDYVTLALSHLGLESLSDPGADRIMFWDDGASGLAWGTATEGIQISGTDIKADINGLTVDSSPDTDADYVMTYDASASTHKKILVEATGPFGGPETTRTINLLQSDNTAAKQAKIDAVGKYVPPDVTVTFQFETGKTHTETDELVWAGFFGGGVIHILGNTGEANASTLHTTQDTIIDVSGQGVHRAIRLESSSVNWQVKNLKLITPDVAGYNTAGIWVKKCLYQVYIAYNYIVCDGKTRDTSGVRFFGCPMGRVNYTYVDNVKYGIMCEFSRVESRDNDDTGTQPDYGLYCTQTGTIGKWSTQPAGAIANELEEYGGEIR